MKNLSNIDLLYLLAGVVFLVLNILRIVGVPFTCDESYSYLFYISQPYNEILTSSSLPTANNHILNSLLSKGSITLFSDTDFFLRLPNLFGQLLYLFSSYWIARQLFNNSRKGVVFFLLLQLNLYQFEFWGLCRGYGLATAFMMASIACIIAYTKRRILSYMIVGFVCVMASVYSNLSLINFFLAFCFVALVVAIWQKEKIVQIVFLILICSGVLYLLLADTISLLIKNNQFYYGGDTGFIRDTIQTLISNSIYISVNESLLFIISIMTSLSVLLVMLFWLARVYKKEPSLQQSILMILLVISILSILLQHYILGTKFLIGRTALFFYPLFILTVFYSISKMKKRVAQPVLVILLLLLSINFAIGYNTNVTRDWRFDMHVLHVLKRITKNNPDKKIKLYTDWNLTPSSVYYIKQRYSQFFDKTEWYNERTYNPLDYDYYNISGSNTADVPDEYILDTAYLESDILLYKHR